MVAARGGVGRLGNFLRVSLFFFQPLVFAGFFFQPSAEYYFLKPV